MWKEPSPKFVKKEAPQGVAFSSMALAAHDPGRNRQEGERHGYRADPVRARPKDGETLWFFGGLTTFKATAEQTGGRFVLLGQPARVGTASTWHVQSDYEESFYVVEGELTFYLEGSEPIPASAGSFIHVPKGAAHALRVALVLIL